MQNAQQKIQELITKLPPHLLDEAADFMEFLCLKKVTSSTNSNKVDVSSLVGVLADMKSDYTALELQKKANEWRG